MFLKKNFKLGRNRIFIFSRHVSQEYKQFQPGKQDLVRGAAALLLVFYGTLQQVNLSKLIMNWQ